MPRERRRRGEAFRKADRTEPGERTTDFITDYTDGGDGGGPRLTTSGQLLTDNGQPLSTDVKRGADPRLRAQTARRRHEGSPILYLGLVLHNHQPVGNYDFVIEQVYEQAYGPMLDALELHPGCAWRYHHRAAC